MHLKKGLMLLINLIGGSAVLGSYVLGFLSRPGAGDILWGKVPLIIRPFYTVGHVLGGRGIFCTRVPSVRNMEQHLGWKPTSDLTTALRKTLDYHLARPGQQLD